MIKYAVFPGTIESRHDGQEHFISYNRLIELYKLDPRECIDASKPGVRTDGLQPIRPRYDGRYPLLECGQ
jgi:hypothetical protein